MNGHAAMGAEILGRSRIPVFRMAAEVALTHHERYDGTGYPAGLAGMRFRWRAASLLWSIFLTR